MSTGPVTPAPPIRARRAILGMSAILLPLHDTGSIDWDSLEAHIVRTSAAGLVPAVNMDTGYVQLLDARTRERILDLAAAASTHHDGSVAGGSVAGAFVAGAFVEDRAGDPFNLAAHVAAAMAIADRGGTPVIFPSHGLNGLDPDQWVAALVSIGREVDRFIGFELGPQFVPYGRIYPLDAYRGMLGVQQCVAAKHSSLSRTAEWDRLAVRDEMRPDFAVLTGNDLAIDMVMYGSDHLLGLSTFAPEEFARRDAFWRDGDARFHELNDLLQYLGHFTFRTPVPGYRHDAAMVHHLRGWATSERTPDGAQRRPAADREVLAEIIERLDGLMAQDL